MRKSIERGLFKTAAVVLTAALMTGCSSTSDNNEKNNATPTAVQSTDNNSDSNKVTQEVEIKPTSADTATEAPTPTSSDIGDKTETDNTGTVITSKDDYTRIVVEYKNKDLESTFDTTELTNIVFSDSGITVTGDKEVKVSEVDGRQIAAITSKGKYLVSGTCSNGQIVVNADKESDVRLILNGLTLTCPDSAAIYERNCDKLLITTMAGTENTLENTGDIVYDDVEKKNPDACVFAKDDLVLNGNGVLNVKTVSSEGIHSTDSIKIVCGTVNVASGDRGIRGKEFIAIKDGTVTVNSVGDALRTTIDDDATLGYAVIEGGNLTLKTGSEGIQTTGNIQITGGTIDITAEGDKANAMKSDKVIFIENASVTVNEENSLKAELGLLVDEGTVTVK